MADVTPGGNPICGVCQKLEAPWGQHVHSVAEKIEAVIRDYGNGHGHVFVHVDTLREAIK